MLKWLEQYFVFTRSERNGIIALVLLIAAVFILPRAYSFFKPANTAPADSLAQQQAISFNNDYNRLKNQISTADEDSAAPAPEAPAKATNKAPVKYFYFDPNKIGVKEWIQLGLTEKQAASIEKYKAKGGVFKTPEDLKKMYVLKESDYAPLLPYVKIVTGTFQERLSAENIQVNINTADSAQLTTVRGIGPVFASRIIKYRNKIGGYTALQQLMQVKGITPEVFEGIKTQLTTGK